MGEQVAANVAHVFVQLFAAETHLFQHRDVGLDALVEEAPLAGAGFHGQREGGQFPGAFVELDAVQVVGEDLFRDLGRIVAFFLVNGVEQVKGVGEHVAGTARRVADLDVFRAADPEEISFRFFRRDVVLHLLDQLRTRTVEQP
ncbi:hypothetical protein D3C71_1078420 [compost metagenome]